MCTYSLYIFISILYSMQRVEKDIGSGRCQTVDRVKENPAITNRKVYVFSMKIDKKRFRFCPTFAIVSQPYQTQAMFAIYAKLSNLFIAVRCL